MNELWLAVRYLTAQAHCRAKAALRGDPQSGALSLEWIVIAVILLVAAVAAGAMFTKAITAESAKLKAP
jgi:hypothetical protein